MISTLKIDATLLNDVVRPKPWAPIQLADEGTKPALLSLSQTILDHYPPNQRVPFVPLCELAVVDFALTSPGELTPFGVFMSLVTGREAQADLALNLARVDLTDPVKLAIMRRTACLHFHTAWASVAIALIRGVSH